MDETKGTAVFKKGDYVVYKNEGVCLVSEIISKDFGSGAREYYLLRPVRSEHSIIYLPTDKQDIDKMMRLVLTTDGIYGAISSAADLSEDWPNDTKERSNAYNLIISEGDTARIISIWRSLRAFRTDTESRKRKLYASDAALLASAEKTISDEFSFVLGIDKDSVADFIENRISG